MNPAAHYRAVTIHQRCKRLAARGLGHPLASDLWKTGNQTLMAEIEALTDHELTRMRQLHNTRQANR